jgi:hypothetical protein
MAIKTPGISFPYEALEVSMQATRQASQVEKVAQSIDVQAIVLTTPIPQNNADIRKLLGSAPNDNSDSASATSNLLNGFTFKARIVPQGSFSPHEYLPDPCDLAAIPETKFSRVVDLIALHTTIIAPSNYNGDRPKIGDLVTITLSRITRGSSFWYNTQLGSLKNVVDKGASTPPADGSANCTDLETVFKLQSTAGELGQLGQPPTKEELQAIKKTFYVHPKPPDIIVAAKNLGYQVNEDGKINTIGVRSTVQGINSWDDKIYLAYRDSGGSWHSKSYTATTVPGDAYMQENSFQDSKKVAILKPGRYPVYAYGTHGVSPEFFAADHRIKGLRGKRKMYETLTQRKGTVTVARHDWKTADQGAKLPAKFRENSANLVNQDGTPMPQDTGNFGINIHPSSHASDATFSNIGWKSAGCQVFKKRSDWIEAMKLWETQDGEGGNKGSRYLKGNHGTLPGEGWGHIYPYILLTEAQKKAGRAGSSSE